MLFFRHPKPVVDHRAIAVQVVQQQARAGDATYALVAAPRAGAGPAPATVVSWVFCDIRAHVRALSKWNYLVLKYNSKLSPLPASMSRPPPVHAEPIPAPVSSIR
ncbi:hypothetical protein [Pseudoduganella buxea]|uniref:hypothetical protein n=1 Tax=Pseudoduganella buxea TaxID=1949069 RepID=UPI0014783E25|nr:hypothetical protein [Pseudoduganella buxea]